MSELRTGAVVPEYEQLVVFVVGVDLVVTFVGVAREVVQERTFCACSTVGGAFSRLVCVRISGDKTATPFLFHALPSTPLPFSAPPPVT